MHSESILSTPCADESRHLVALLESAYALQEQAGISLRWYDVLVHLEEAPDGRPAHEQARDARHVLRRAVVVVGADRGRAMDGVGAAAGVLEQEQDPGVDAGLGRVGQGTESPPRSPRFRRGPAVRLHPTRGA